MSRRSVRVGKIVLAEAVDWHLFVADDSGVPATLAMIEALPPGSHAIALLEVGGAENEPPFTPPADAPVEIRWLHRGPIEPGHVELLTDAVRTLAIPTGPGHAYLSAELTVVATVRDALLAQGLDAEQLSPKSYWRRGIANAAHGEPPKD